MIRISWRRTLLGLVITVPFLALIFLRTDLRETGEALAGANYALIAVAMVLFVLAVWLQAFRWKLLLRPLADVPSLRLYPVVFIGHMGNSLLPLRGGEILRILVLGQRERLSRMSALGTVAVERVLDGLTLAFLLIVFVLFSDISGRLRDLALVAGIIFGLATLVLLAMAFWEERSRRVAEAVIERAPSRLRATFRPWVASFLVGTRALRTPSGFGGVLLCTVGFWTVIAAVYYVVGRAFDIEQGFGTYLLVAGAANLSLSLPSSQGGLGPFEFFAKESLVLAGVATPLATAYALALHAVVLIPMITLGLVSLWALGLSLDKMLRPPVAMEAAQREAAQPSLLPSTPPRTSASLSAGGRGRKPR